MLKLAHEAEYAPCGHELPPKVRHIVFRECARVLKPGGRLVLVDSLQRGDQRNYEGLLELFPQNYHEPYYKSYTNEDFSALAIGCGLTHQMRCMITANCDGPVAFPMLTPNARNSSHGSQFLIKSLRDHSVLSLIWVLSALTMRSRRSLIFAEPTRFGFAPESVASDAEADPVVLLDGQATLCEIKSSWHSLRLAHIEDFVALASRLRPDIALLAVMEAGPGSAADLAAAEAQLAAEGIKFELLMPREYMSADDPYLDFDDDG